MVGEERSADDKKLDPTNNKKRGSVSNLRFENFYIEGAAGGPTIDQNSGNNGRTPCFVRPGGSEKKEVSGTNA